MPRFSDDQVVQWLVEEAVMDGLRRHEQEQERQASRAHELDAAQQRVRGRLDETRRAGR